MGIETVFYPPTPNTSMRSDDGEQQNLTPLLGDPKQHILHIPQRRNHLKQLCQHLQPLLDTSQSPTQTIKDKKTFSVTTTQPTYRQQDHKTTSPVSRQWLMACKI